MRRLLALLPIVMAAASCGGDAGLLANEQLSQIMAVGNVVKQNVFDANDLLIGQRVDVDLHHTGLHDVEDPFIATWALLEPGGGRYAVDSVRVDRMAPAQTRRLTFHLDFPPTESLAGYRDGVTFHFVEPFRTP